MFHSSNDINIQFIIRLFGVQVTFIQKSVNVCSLKVLVDTLILFYHIISVGKHIVLYNITICFRLKTGIR